MPKVFPEVARHRARRSIRWTAAAALTLLVLAAHSGFSVQDSSPRESGLRLGLVERQPLPGAARIPLEQAVAAIRHDYGRFVLARFTAQQEECAVLPTGTSILRV